MFYKYIEKFTTEKSAFVSTKIFCRKYYLGFDSAKEIKFTYISIVKLEKGFYHTVIKEQSCRSDGIIASSDLHSVTLKLKDSEFQQ